MTVYELIQALAQYDPGNEVRIGATVVEFDYDCPECGKTITIPSDTGYRCGIDDVALDRNDSTRVLIECDVC